MKENHNETSIVTQALPEFDNFGVSRNAEGYQFTVAVPYGETASLLLYRDNEKLPCKEIELPPENRRGDVASVWVKGISPKRYTYNYKIGEEIVQDPYAVSIKGREEFGVKPDEKDEHKVRCRFGKNIFRWEDDGFKPHPLSESILYKVQVRSFTKQNASGVRSKGTFKGLTQKIEYLKELGITSVLLMPAYEFDEFPKENKRKQQKRPYPAETIPSELPVRLNCWGYTGNAGYFAPKASFSATDNPEKEFKEMVQALHKEGLECFMEFYFDGSVSPSMMLDIVRFWKREYHLDGFHLMGNGICTELFAKDPFLTDVKLIFTQIDGGYIYKGETPGRKNLAVYNDEFLYCMRHLLKGDEGMMEEFRYRNKYNPKENGIINYLADQNGFTMMDMVSYDEKHNEANGENNQDGLSYNCSWNCGIEGPSRKKLIRELRIKQMKNAFFLLFLSQGTPMIFQGDEFGNSQQGNNNAYCQDNDIGWVDWKAKKTNQEILEFVKEAIRFRKEHKILQMEEELRCIDYKAMGYPDLSYHGAQAWFAPCEQNYRHMGMMYCEDYGNKEKQVMYVGYNMHWIPHEFALPTLPKGSGWKMEYCTEDDAKKIKLETKSVSIPPRTIIILLGKQE